MPDSGLVDPSTGEPWTPEFPGQRPPFQPGNTLSVKHGIWSPAKVEPVAAQLITDLLADPSLEYLTAPRFARSVHQWAIAQAKVDLLSEWVDGMDIQAAADSDRGKTSPLELLRKWMTTAQGYAQRLGLDPLSAARLGKDIAGTRQADAATLLTQARAAAESNTSSTN